MLSKSQARLFFIAGTVLFSFLFLALSVDTILKVPKLTNQKKMSAAVIRGKAIWDHNNCMGCHTLLGEGAYYAPELTKIYLHPEKSKNNHWWLRFFLKDPQAAYPGQRKMVNYHFNDKQIDDLLAFFKWISEIDTQKFPAPTGKNSPILKEALNPGQAAKKKAKPVKRGHPAARRQVKAKARPTAIRVAPRAVAKAPATKPTTNPTTNPTTKAAVKKVAPRKALVVKVVKAPSVFGSMCKVCHSVDGKGGTIGPALDGVSKRFTKAYLYKWISDPKAMKPTTKMPKLPVTKAQLDEIVAYLSTL